MAYTTIDDPSVHFQMDKYTADGSADTVTFDGNSNLQPDLLWVKSLDTAYNHQFHDSSRGATTGAMYTNLGDAEDSTYHVDSFNTDGYTNDSVNTAIHDNNENIMSYGWKANGGTTTSVSASGSGASRVAASNYQADTTSKFSICTWTGTDDTAAATITHGLGVAPEFIIIKCRNEASTNWTIYHHKNTTAPATDILEFDSGATSDNDRFNDTAPTSTVFSVNASSSTVNANGDTYVAYCWAGVQGYSKFGHYTGNGTANGTFAYTGFKPAWVLLKNTAATAHWVLYDTKRNPGNVTNSKLSPSAANTAPNGAPGLGDTGYNMIDIYSNGFKMRSNNAASNTVDVRYIYVAFAEEPLVTSGGVPATAR